MKAYKKLYTYVGIALAVLVAGNLVLYRHVKTEAQKTNKIATMQYSEKLFDDSYVHTINIDIAEEDWEKLLANPTEESFYSCNLTIDGETYNNVGIRTKGNSSLTQVADSDSDRYSFKINMGKYDKEQDYYGLDKFVLNNLVQDATMMKDYLSYKLMSEFNVPSPEVSYSYVTINGEDWGLYLNAECLDEAFLERNYGTDYGNLYKPSTDEMMMGKKGGKPDGEFKPDEKFDPTKVQASNSEKGTEQENGQQPERPEMLPTEGKDGQDKMGMGEPPSFGKGETKGADLKYTDDNYDSYSAIFDNAKTKIEDADKDTLIQSLKQLSEGSQLDEVVDIDEVLRYFVVHNFVDNYDSYTGNMLHNYYLYEKDGKLSLLPWDYNLAFGAFGGGPGRGEKPNMGNPKPGENNESLGANNENTKPDKNNEKANLDQKNNASEMVNMAIDTPLSGAEEEERPMWSKLISNEDYKVQYHELFDEFIKTYIESGKIEAEIDRVSEMISPYVEKDPTAFYKYEEFQKAVETLKSFISLRGKSIRLQLLGEIPSTTEGQKSFEGSLVDASSINLNDMGSSGGGKDRNQKLKGTSIDNNQAKNQEKTKQ